MSTPALVQNKRHQWGEAVHLCESDVTDRTERTCKLCGLVKLTLHPPHGLPWREWRQRGAAASFKCEGTPPCNG